jgi:polyphosphate glucokinase
MNNSRKETIPFKILALDIGGSTIKATILDEAGNILQDYKKEETPKDATPENILKTIQTLAKYFKNYDKVSVGFPGYVKRGIVFTAPNLGTDAWTGTNLNKLIHAALNKPVRIVNDADMQGLAVVSGEGLEMVITLGTGFGTALLQDGHLLPHIELAHHNVTKNNTYDDYVGDHALKSKGEEKWHRRMKRILVMLKTVFNYDRLYIGGGNANKLNFKLDKNIIIISNMDGIKGGSKLWQLDENLFMKSSTTLS